jgi:YegS/Rv2252/BmrU family lipid kinase
MAGDPERLAVLVNPRSGTMGEALRTGIDERLRGRAHRVFELDRGGDGAALVEDLCRSGVEEVWACGGDGTVHAAINGIARSHRDSILAILPSGTANLIAASLGVPTDPGEALGNALSGAERRIDLGRFRDRFFALGLGAGLAARFALRAQSNAKRKFGSWAYLTELARELGSRPRPLQARVDGIPVSAPPAVGALILNAAHLSSNTKAISHVRLDDGMLDLLLLHRFGLADGIRLAIRAASGRVAEDRAVTAVQGAAIRLDLAEVEAVQMDGERTAPHRRIEATAVPRALRVRAPKESRDQEVLGEGSPA